MGSTLLRDNLAYKGWTEFEVRQLQSHISYVWLPLVREYLSQLYDADDAARQARVLKLHLILRHATERLLTIGSLQVRCALRSI